MRFKNPSQPRESRNEKCVVKSLWRTLNALKSKANEQFENLGLSTPTGRMGKTRDHFKKIKDTKGTFHAKMGSIKDSNGRDLTEAEDIKKRWQEYTEKLYKKDLHNPYNHLESDNLECEGKWALGSITMNKANGSDGIPVELFKS